MSIHPGQIFSEELKIQAYDIHTYYFQSHEPSRQEAIALRDKLAQDFSEEVASGAITIKKLWDRPIGPHPYAMWESQFSSPELFARIVPWYQLNHGSLSVLIHPHTDKGEKVDHDLHAMWIGDRVKLINDVLSS